MAKTYENLMLQQMKALQSWRAAVSHYPHVIDETQQGLVRTLLALCVEYMTDPSTELEQDITEEAHELADAVLPHIDVELAIQIFRDELVDSILKNLSFQPDAAPRVLRFSNLISDAFYRVYSESLKRTIRHQKMESLSNELRVAKGIQQRLVPQSAPKVEGFDFAGRLIPAAEIGGDYWSIKEHLEENIITIKLADVSGHGIAAATLVSAVKFISGGYFQSAKTPSWVMEQTNRVLAKETPTEILVSMVYGWIYTKTKEISIVNAGHEPVFICNPEGCMDIPPTGPVLGISEARYGETKLQLRPNDILFFGSDGITEAGRGTPFGVARLKRLISENRHLPAGELADRIIERVMDFAGGKIHDDLSLVIAKVTEDVAIEE
ncbi:MAG: PP2C family protein-serine/threonine phosphatase [Armatimonadota bacterium]|nr:PP2C family protein-serine/threonine phosphatase [Armatimonadota bacterium]